MGEALGIIALEIEAREERVVVVDGVVASSAALSLSWRAFVMIAAPEGPLVTASLSTLSAPSFCLVIPDDAPNSSLTLSASVLGPLILACSSAF